jgi:SNF2 family DNA or RNA helicase
MSLLAQAEQKFNGRLIGPYQRQGVDWMLQREVNPGKAPMGGFLCDEMGLGKTAEVIATMLGNPLGKTLIVTPRSVVTQWVEEINRFAPGTTVGVYDSRKVKSQTLEDNSVVVTSYGMTMDRTVPNGTTALHGVKWDRIVLDEGHEIRNKNSKTYKSISHLRYEGQARWIVSGTPVFNSIKDFVALAEFVGYCPRFVQAYHSKIRELSVLRRTKEDVAKFNSRLALPPCDFENVELEMSPAEQAVYSRAWHEARDIIMEIFRSSENIAAHNMNILECLLRVRQTMIHPQLYLDGMTAKGVDESDPVSRERNMFEGNSTKFDYIHESIKSHPLEKSLIFCQFITEMNMLEELLVEGGHRVFRIDGSVAPSARDINIQAFRKATDSPVFLIQVKAGGVGLNLQEATRVYITAPTWNPATELQAVGRSHRTGQTQKVWVKKLIYMGDEDLPSVEQSIMALQGHKAAICAEVLNDPRINKQIPITNKKGISIRAIRQIFTKPKKI